MTASPKHSPRHAKGQLSREKLLDAAADCFRKEGFHSSIAQISKTAGMSPGHIYHFFKSKEEIVEAIAEREEREMQSLHQEFENYTDDEDIADVLIKHTRTMIRRMTRPDYSCLTLELAAEATRNSRIRDCLIKTDLEIAQGFRNKLANHNIGAAYSEEEIVERMQVVIALMEGLKLRLISYPELNLDTTERHIKNIIKMLLGPSPTPSE